MVANVSMHQSERLVERGVKQNQRKDLKLLIQFFWDVTTFQLVKDDLPGKNNASIFSIKQYKENGFFNKLWFNLLELINVKILISRSNYDISNPLF